MAFSMLYKFVMAKKQHGKALTQLEVDATCERILSGDIEFAESLTEVMKTFIDKKKGIRTYGELRIVQEARKALMGKQDLGDILGEVKSIEVKFVEPTG